MEKTITQSVPMSAASVAMCSEAGRQLAAHGADVRRHLELSERIATVRTAPTKFRTQEKSALTPIWVKSAPLTGQLSDYGFGTPVGVDVPRVDVAAGVPPRSRPV